MRMPRFTEDIRPLSEFRANAAAFVQQVRETRRPLVLTQHGRSAAVLLAVTEYERLMERAELLEGVSAAEVELERGEGRSHRDAKEEVPGRIRRRRHGPEA